MKRSKHSLSHYHLTTMEMGKIIPVGLFEALPGDTIQQATSALVRVSPLLAPVMHPVSVKIHHWFVPNRLIWDGWEDFITGGPDGFDATEWPHMTHPVVAGTLQDYFGLPPGTDEYSALPFRAYNLIYNEFYRDQDLMPERVVSTLNGGDSTTNDSVATAAWEKDYFTSARPWPQKGPEVTIPLGLTAEVVSNNQPIKFKDPVGEYTFNRETVSSQAGVLRGNPSQDSASDSWFGSQTGLQADLTNVSAVDINSLRRAFALQRYEEARARYGSRYTEYLRYLGVRSSDARLQRPEYLGGGKQTIQFSEVLQTGPGTDDEGVAQLKGHGIGAMRSNRYRRFFEEHGLVLSLMVVRPKTIYADMQHRMWNRTSKEDYFQKELQHIGQQEIRNREVAPGASNPAGVWGYQDRYDDYRRMESRISGEFQSTLDFWHYARMFSTAPVLNGDFVTANVTKRVYAEQTTNPLWCMINHSIQARRMVASSGKSFIY